MSFIQPGENIACNTYFTPVTVVPLFFNAINVSPYIYYWAFPLQPLHSKIVQCISYFFLSLNLLIYDTQLLAVRPDHI